MGDAVNIASRLEGETKHRGYSILLGPATRDRVPIFATVPLERIQLRGRVESLEVFALIGAGSAREAATRPSRDPPSR